MTDAIKAFFDNDDRKAEQLIRDYPQSIPIPVAAEFLGIDAASLRAMAIEGHLGSSWKKEGKLNRGFFLPTAQFLRWYRYGN